MQNLYLGRWKAGEVNIRKMELLCEYIMKCEIKNPYFSRYSSCVRVPATVQLIKKMQIREITDFFFSIVFARTTTMVARRLVITGKRKIR